MDTAPINNMTRAITLASTGRSIKNLESMVIELALPQA
jgi:hypothetical protein